MSDGQVYLTKRVRLGWGLLILGVLLFVSGLALQLFFQVSFNPRVISGPGIFIGGVGLALILRYRVGRGDRQAAARRFNEERDERNRLIRARAGSRAFWIVLAMNYAALMWLSFASNGNLPRPSLDGMWFYLAAAVVVPFIVYISSILYDQRNS